MKPNVRPANPRFSSGPCAKRPGWTPDALKDALLGRSHRSKDGKRALGEAIARTRKILEIPDEHRIIIMPASQTGAMEAALWNLLGPRPVVVIAFESFGLGWAKDVTEHLKLKDTRVLAAPYGSLPDLSKTNPAHDVVLVWNGTTSGVCIPDGNWISDRREGLTICDATSAAFAMKLPWGKLDAATFSWQKALGGEAQHGIMIMSPRAVERLESHRPPWPLPKLFRLTKGGKVTTELYEGSTINTPSMLVVEDYLDALRWAEGIGGLEALIRKSRENAGKIFDWIARTPWAENLAERKEIRSTTSVCIKIADGWFAKQDKAAQWAIVKKMTALLEQENAAYDIAIHRDAPPGLRIWAGPTVEGDDLEALFPWLEWAWRQVKE